MNTLIQKVVNGMISLALISNFPQLISLDLPRPDISDTALVALSPLDEGVQRIEVDITAYSSTPDQTDDTPFITASGTRVRDGIVAANFLPMNSRIKIPELFGEKVFVVEDRMHRRFQNRVDIWFPDRETAWKFGLQKAEIVVL